MTGGHHAGLDGAPRGTTHAGGRVGVAERHALRGEFLHVGHVAKSHGRFRQIRAHAHRRAEPRHVVDENEDDVGRLRRALGGGGAGARRADQQEEERKAWELRHEARSPG